MGGIGLYTCGEGREGREGIGREEPARSQRLRPGELKDRQRCPLFTWNLNTLMQDKPWVGSLHVSILARSWYPDICCCCLVTKLCQLFCNPMDCSPLGSSVQVILQVRILEWVAMPSSRGSSRPRDQTRSPALQADSLPSEPPDLSQSDPFNALPNLQHYYSVPFLLE